MKKTEASPKLMYGSPNNFGEWRRELTQECMKMFGKQANLLKTNTAYVVPAVTVEDCQASIEALDMLEGAEISSSLRKEAEKSRARLVRKMRDDEPAFYVKIWESMSVESQICVSHQEGYEAVDLEQDATGLWMIVVNTHQTNAGGGGAKNQIFERTQLSAKFEQLSQGALPIGEFKTKYSLLRPHDCRVHATER
jgi:hypothetical protein